MTKEEAIEFGNMWLEMNEDCKDTNTYTFFQMSIKALEQEPCDDVISRQTVLDMMQIKMGEKELYKAVYDLPSVTQKPKTGRWIDAESLDGALWYACSECGETEFYATNYCPNCGVKMEDEEVVYKGLYLRGTPDDIRVFNENWNKED